MPDVLDHLRTHLIAEGVGRNPRVAGPLPPIWLHPENGTPAPGETVGHVNEVGADAVLALYLINGLRSGPFEGWRRRPIVEVDIRTKKMPKADELGRQVRVAVIGVTSAPKVAWLMGGLQVIASQEWRPLQPLAATQGFRFSTAFLFDLYA